jgi:hypothetical protein
MIKRLGVVALLLTVMALAFTALLPAGADKRFESVTLRLAEVAGDDDRVFVDVGAEGVSVGDYFTLFNPIYNRSLKKQVGQANGPCFVTVVDAGEVAVVECDLTYDLPGGNITVEGPFDLRETDNVFAITGGTDSFETAHGELEIVSTEAGLVFTFELLL